MSEVRKDTMEGNVSAIIRWALSRHGITLNYDDHFQEVRCDSLSRWPRIIGTYDPCRGDFRPLAPHRAFSSCN